MAVGDIHIADRHLTLTEEALENTLKAVTKYRNECDFVVVMGDIFDRHNNIKQTHRHMALEFIEKLKAIKTTIVLLGNHDMVNNKAFMPDVHPFEGISDIPTKLYIANKPKVILVNKQHILFMPYVPPGKFIDGINMFLNAMHKNGKLLDVKDTRGFAMVFGHQEFRDAPYGPIKSVIGDEWPSNYPQVISGHIHDKLRLKHNVFYTGSLYPINISESSDKGVILGSYDPQKKHLEYKVIRVVMSMKNVIRLSASDEDSVREMVCLDRKNTKYIVQGTPEELEAIKAKVKGKGINIAYDARPRQLDIKAVSFDQIVQELVGDDKDMGLLLRELSE